MKKIDDIKKFASNDDLKWFSCAKTSKIKATKAKGGEEIKTVLADGTEETDVRVANPGDWIVTNPDGEKYIIPDAKFQSRYEATDEEGSYKPRFKKMFATKLADDVEFAPPKWGGDVQRIKAGGYLMRDPSDAEDIYGIAKDEFEKTYSKLQEKKEQKYTKKQITEAIKHWKKVLEQMDENEEKEVNESEASEKFHSMKSAARTENKETAKCALMFKASGSKVLYRWVPYDEVYDMFFDEHWEMYSEIDDNAGYQTHKDIKKKIDEIYGM